VLHDLERQHEQFESRISFLQNYDSLTGLPSRPLLESRLAEAIAGAERADGQVGVFVMNLDDFKDINDSLGYEVGDEVLRIVGQRISAVIGLQDTLARLSGDEFAIVRRISAEQSAEEYARDILRVFETPIPAAGQSIYVTAAVGIARYPEDASSAAEVLRAADTAMFDAKEARSGYALFHTGLAEEARDRLALANDLQARFRMAVMNFDEKEVAELITDPNTIIALSDAGAHASQLCDACYSTHLLGHWVRDRKVFTLEEAVHNLTQRPAEMFGITDRGVLAEGRPADVVVFDPKTVSPGPMKRVYDMPAGADRLVSEASGIDAVVVNGKVIRRDNKDTVADDDKLPGRLLRHGRAA